MKLIGKVTAVKLDGHFEVDLERDQPITEGGGTKVGMLFIWDRLGREIPHNLGDSVLLDIDVRTIAQANEELEQIAVEQKEQQGHYVGDLALDNPPAGE